MSCIFLYNTHLDNTIIQKETLPFISHKMWAFPLIFVLQSFNKISMDNDSTLLKCPYLPHHVETTFYVKIEGSYYDVFLAIYFNTSL